MVDLYDTIQEGQLALIRDRPAVFLFYASYGGGSGPLWAIQGEEYQFATAEYHGYQRGRCRRVTPETIEIVMRDGRTVTIAVAAFERLDQHHLPGGQRFDFEDSEIELITFESSGAAP